MTALSIIIDIVLILISIVLIVSFISPPTRLKIFATEYISMSANVTDVMISSRV